MAYMMEKGVGKFAFRHVPLNARQDMADILDPPSSFGLSWMNFAEKLNRYSDKLNFNPIKLNAIESRHRQSSPTLEVFRLIESSNAITTDIVQEVLIEMSSAATDILPRYIHVIARNASSELLHVTKPGHHDDCHCVSCIQYCDCPQHDNRETRINTGHCGHIGHNVNRPCCQRDCSEQRECVGHNTRGKHIKRPQITIPVHSQMCPNQEFERSRRDPLSPQTCVQMNQQHCCRNHGHGVYNINNNNLGQSEIFDMARQNVTKFQNIELSENHTGPPDQYNPSCITTSNNTSGSVHHNRNDSTFIQAQGQICGENEDNSDNNNIDWIPPEDDVETDCGCSTTSLFSENSPSDINQSQQRINESQKNQSQLSRISTEENESIQSQSSVDTTRYQLQTQFVPIRQSIEKTDNGQVNLQCTCPPEEQRFSLPVLRPPHLDVRKKCMSESDADQHTRRRQIEESACICRNRKKIFISYAVDNTKHLEEVVAMQKAIRDKGNYIVKSDVTEEIFQKKMANSHDWLEEEFQNADYVIFCISPKFYEYIQPDFEEGCVVYPANFRLHTRFIFDLARTEYVTNGSKNKRFLPVIFNNSGANGDHLPKFMHATIVYRYPETFEQLLSYLEQVH